MKISKRKTTRPVTDNTKRPGSYLLKVLSKFDGHKPSDNRIDRMNRRQRKAWAVREFAEFGSSIVFELTNGMPDNWETTGVDTLFEILDNHNLDTVISWDENWKQLKQFELKIYDRPNATKQLAEPFVWLVANEINKKVFNGSIGNIRLNFDALWDDDNE